MVCAEDVCRSVVKRWLAGNGLPGGAQNQYNETRPVWSRRVISNWGRERERARNRCLHRSVTRVADTVSVEYGEHGQVMTTAHTVQIWSSITAPIPKKWIVIISEQDRHSHHHQTTSSTASTSAAVVHSRGDAFEDWTESEWLSEIRFVPKKLHAVYGGECSELREMLVHENSHCSTTAHALTSPTCVLPTFA